jgi:hypothetical protein
MQKPITTLRRLSSLDSSQQYFLTNSAVDSSFRIESAVRQHQAEWRALGFSSWGQFIAMLFCQLGHAKSLGEICVGSAAGEGNLRHLGLPSARARSTLAYANEHRPLQFAAHGI